MAGLDEKNIEVEIKSFITPQQYHDLLLFFNEHATYLSEDDQETWYFEHPHDIRIQRNETFSKIVLKHGKVHDECREEMEIRVEKDDFSKLEKLFSSLGIGVKVKWLRNRHSFDWNGISVALDYTKGYGHIIELEQMSTDINKEKTLHHLKKGLAGINVTPTPREVFEEKYKHYVNNWQTLILQD